ncbi:hypothetical protein KOEU_26280 [Komagataeibacter europaeus]|uniref:Uncharacterized protein n=1 Tax=Komagataeibacter europaeus TaxID=33995 RepID=A0A0M0EF97_KOMEU|nr:hypothetical protein KOEU_26280 [Komagataeibacter europaeus]
MAAIRSRHPGKDIEIWWSDEARIGQKTKLDPTVGETGHPAPGRC